MLFSKAILTIFSGYKEVSASFNETYNCEDGILSFLNPRHTESRTRISNITYSLIDGSRFEITFSIVAFFNNFSMDG